MTAGPSVTCIMIFLDGAAFIDEAIRSVVAQGDGVDWDLVLVDDGSNDGSTAIARRWADSDHRIRYIEHDGHANLGTGPSRSAGLTAARGDYVAFLDCDDVWLSSALPHSLRVFAHHPEADVVIGGAWRWHGWTGEHADSALDRLADIPDAVTHTVIEPPALLADIYRSADAFRMPVICSVLIARAALLRVGGFDNSFRGLYEDQVLYAKIALQLRAVVDPRPMALYRQHDSSVCRVAMDSGEWQWTGPSEPQRQFVEWLRTYIIENVGGDIASLDVVRRNLEPDDLALLGSLGEAPQPSQRPIPETVRRAVRRVRRRRRPSVWTTTVVGHWSEQFLAPTAHSIDGATLVIVARGDDRPWVGAPPVGVFIDGATRRTWSVAVNSGKRYDRLVVPIAVATTVGIAALLEGVGRLVVPGGAALLVVPGPAVDADWPDADRLTELIRCAIPDQRVDVEWFGNAMTVADLDADAASLGAWIDRHDPAVPAMYGVAITPAVGPQ